MQKWLARLSFSFLIVAAVLLWEANKLMRAGGGGPKLVLYIVGVVVLAVLGGAGIRARHRQDPS